MGHDTTLVRRLARRSAGEETEFVIAFEATYGTKRELEGEAGKKEEK